MGTATHLHDAAGSRAEIGVGHRLDAVDDDELRLRRVEGGDHMRERGLGEQPQMGTERTQPLGTKSNLLSTLFPAHVQRACRPCRSQLQQERALADTRLAAQQGHRAGNQATAEDAIELFDSCRLRAADQRLDLGDRHCRCRGRSGREERGDIGIRTLDVFHHRVPRLAR
jgi:hypothetical protein